MVPCRACPAGGRTDSARPTACRPGISTSSILSDELAFRAEFADARPDSRQLYWRGPVLWEYDGRAWHTAMPVAGSHSRPGAAEGRPIRYAVTLEPHRQRWLFLLGLPTSLPDNLQHSLGPDLQWLAREPVNQRLRYELEAHLDYRLEPQLSAESRRQAWPCPRHGTPLPGTGPILAAGGDGRRLRRPPGLDLFRQQPFFYTLDPALAGRLGSGRFPVHRPARILRALCQRLRLPHAGRRGAGAGGHRLSGRRTQPVWQLLDRAWAGCPRLGRGLAGGAGLDAGGPHRRRGPRPGGTGRERPRPAGGNGVPSAWVAFDGAWLRPLRLGWGMVSNRWNQWVTGATTGIATASSSPASVPCSGSCRTSWWRR
ncbi:MAG: DUF3488 domain-containing protein [Hydrogenophilales bacterium]|nr:DUF3488 domain-containing protein [Hydrogenophilales bacterium]